MLRQLWTSGAFHCIIRAQNPYPNGETEKTGNPRFEVAGFFFSTDIKNKQAKKTRRANLRVNPSFGRVEETQAI
jgi:hypothetical protein